MRSAAPEYCPLDFCPTGQAGLSIPSINLEVILKLSAPVNSIQTGALIHNASSERLPDCLEEVFQIAV